MTDDPVHEPVRKEKRSHLPGWGLLVALLGAGALPCPDCGMPLAWHLWPLAVLILAARRISARRERTGRGADVSTKPPEDSGEPQEP
jgi:hypothetical protein